MSASEDAAFSTRVRAFKRRAWVDEDFVRGYVRRTSGNKGIARVKNTLEARFVLRHARGRVLDAGCGAGRLLGPLASAGLRPFGSDLSLAMLAQSQERVRTAGAEARLLQADIERLPFAAESFDTLLSITVLEHFPGYAGILSEYARVLRPGGTLLFEMPNAEQAPAEEVSAEAFVNRLRPGDFAAVLEPLGLRLLEVHPYDFWNGNQALARRWRLGAAGQKRVQRWANRLLGLPGAAALWVRCEPALLRRLGTGWAPNLLARAVKAG
ncbi:MAG: methyltransferase domain-containing protein [Planctomycetota bacterium]